MTPQEKAEAYDKALEEAKKWHKAFVMGQNYPATDIKVSYECIFPELKESEDERIRKALIYHFGGDGCICTNEYRIDYKDICAWLEKQGQVKELQISQHEIETCKENDDSLTSEDEKIRKWLIDYLWKEKIFLQETHSSVENNPKYRCVMDAIAWLEKLKEPKDNGEISDGYHTFNELYYYRMLYNAAFFNLLPKEWVHKSKKHHDGEECFGGGWFIVMANLPTGQISNHYELKDWDLFQIQEKEIADEWDGHTPQEAAERLHKYLLDCCKTNDNVDDFNEIEAEAPMGYGKFIDEKLQEAAKRYFADEKDPNRYCLADVFYAGMRAEREKLKS